MTLQARVRFFLGSAAPVIPTWYLSTSARAFLGKSFSSKLPLDFAILLTFIALFSPLLRSAAHISAALPDTIAIAIAISNDVPFNLGLIMAGFVVMSMGAATEWHLRYTAVSIMATLVAPILLIVSAVYTALAALQVCIAQFQLSALKRFSRLPKPKKQGPECK